MSYCHYNILRKGEFSVPDTNWAYIKEMCSQYQRLCKRQYAVTKYKHGR